MRNLIIGGIEIPIDASHRLSQQYTEARAVNRVRMSDGTLKQQTSWDGKIITQISGSGILPIGLDGLDYKSAITIQCIAERRIASATNAISIPSGRRSDYAVEGEALVDGKWQSTPVSMTGDTATLTTVAGATQYQTIYWPEIICFVDPPELNRDARTSSYTWRIDAEEI